MLPPAQSALPKPSLYQRRILEFVRSGTGHGVVRATAGAGKTTTLVQVASSLPADLRVCFLAFAKDAAKELRQRLPRGVEAMTVHKLGLRTLACHLRGRGVKQLEVDASKYRALVRAELADVKMGYAVSEETLWECEEYLMDLVHYARLNLTDTKDPEEVRALAVRYNFTPPYHLELEDEMHERLRIVLRKGMAQALTRSLLRGSGTGKLGLIDFTDMIYLPYILKMEPTLYDFVCVDEAQDYSALALKFTMRLVGEGGRLLFVGDPRQSIFGFAGADTDALDRIVRHTQATVLPLSITYRCPRAHVELARLVAPEIEASPHAQKGRIFWIKDDMLEKWVYEGDMIICRNNAPLVGTCLRLVRSGKRAYVKGRDLAKQLQTVSRKVFVGGFDNYYGKLDRFAREEELRLRKALRGQANTDTVVARRLDLIDCLYYLVEDLVESTLPSLEKLEALIHKTFGEEGPAVMLSTVHRAKGKEANRVVILYPELMPAVYARTSEAVRGEACVQFVALTRARHDLVFVESPPKEEPIDLIELAVEEA
jgi:DNA helicase II / ATP-dependent DNA helicase PcrA